MGEKHRSLLLRLLTAQYKELVGYLTSRTGSPSLAADAAQETFLRLRTVTEVPDVQNPRSYLFRVADNIATDHLRRGAVQRQRLVNIADHGELPDETPSLETVAADRQRIDVLTKALADLPPRCRDAFLLHKFDGLSHAEVAERLGISRSMVEKHVMKALAHCRDRLDGTAGKKS